MYNYSFIIPHKNSPELLQRCLKSIPDRDDVQIIIVDDNSDGNVVDFTHFPGMSRRNTECIFNDAGGGAGRARNIALNKALGKWLVFADADDYFSESLASILDKYKDDEETEIVFFNYCKSRGEGEDIVMPITRYIRNYQNSRLFSEMVLRYSAWSPWSRMIKRELQVSNKLRFEELPFSNDMMFVLKATSLAQKIVADPTLAYYYYCPLSGTQTSVQFHDPNNKQLRLEGAYKLRRFYKSVGYRFISPIWRTEKSLGIKANAELKVKYGFKNYYNLCDTITYLFAKLFKIL